ncbi:MAG: hypothetical protein KA140_00150 [Caldisericia bacterium]|nr:hypothetical protein [Caldisericia bacterium]
MKRVFLGFVCLIVVFGWMHPAQGLFKYKKLWEIDFDRICPSSSIHYTSDTIVVVSKHGIDDDEYFYNTYSYCSGTKLNNTPFNFPKNVLPETIEAYEGKLIYLTRTPESKKEFVINCTNLNFEQLWRHEIINESDVEFVWCEVADDLVVVHLDKEICIYNLKSGKFLCKLYAGYVETDSIWNGLVLIKPDQLKLIDPNTQKPVWTYEISKPGLICHGIRKNIVLLSTRKPLDDYPPIVVCLDAFTGKEVFKMEYSGCFVVDIGISGDILGIVSTDENKGKLILDAFKIDSWTFIWSINVKKLSNWIIFSNNSMYLLNFCCPDLLTLSKIDSNTGEHDCNCGFTFVDEVNWMTFISPRNVVFQNNRIITSNDYFSVSCLVDESF